MSHLKKLLTAAAAIAVAAAAFVPAIPAGTPLLNVSLGAALDATFDDEDGGWSANPATPLPPPTRPAPVSDWAWGAPTNGPGVAASGNNVWATNLAGNYRNSHCAGLMSAPIAIPAGSTASISWRDWHHFELSSLTGTGWDAGILFVTSDGGNTLTAVTPSSGYGTNTVSTTARGCLNGVPTTQKGIVGPVGTTLPAPTYGTNSVDLSAFAGQSVQFVFGFGSDGTGQRAGWYLDDVTVTIDGVSTVEDFETTDGGFTVIGTKPAPAPHPDPQGWSWGTPTNGPGPVSAMWATNPTGTYGATECAWVESPAFKVGDLPAEAAALGRATLTWDQWFKAATGAAGVVQIGNASGYAAIEPTTGYPSVLPSGVADCLGSGRGFAGTQNPTPTMTPFEADVSAYLGQEITVRFLFASPLTYTVAEGWYVDNVVVETFAYAEQPDPFELLPENPLVGGSDAPLWTSGGTSSSWEYGVATTGPVNETVYGTNLDGNYNTRECSYVESPAVPGALFAGSPSLSFEQWYRIESIFTTSAFDGAVVAVSNDGGANWTAVSTGTNSRTPLTTLKTCLTAMGLPTTITVTGGASGGWVNGTADLSAFATGGDVKVRFIFGSDGSVQYEGWYLRNVVLGGVKLL